MASRVNWRQAFAEVFLLVAGAAIALGLDAWNDWRLERREEAGYLADLARDFERTRADFAEAIRNNESVRDNSLALLEAVSGPPGSVPADSLRTLSETVFHLYPFNPVMGAYHDMVNSGKLELLGNDTLRLALAQFDSHLERLDASWAEGWDQYNLIQVPFAIEHLNLPRFYAGGYGRVTFPEPRFGPDLETYWSREFANLLTVGVVSKEDILRRGEELLQEAEQVLQLIRAAQEGGWQEVRAPTGDEPPARPSTDAEGSRLDF